MSASAVDKNDSTRSFRILALHGKGNNGDTFRRTLEPLEDSLSTRADGVSFEFTYLTAPFGLDHKNNKSKGRAWWGLPPGERSFTASEYIGYEESVGMVEEALCTGDGYDFVLGHSQGAILLSVCLATTINMGGGGRAPIGYVLNGAAWPNPFGDRMERFTTSTQLGDDHEQPPELEALFVIGDGDDINPPEGAERVRDCLDKGGVRAETCRHAGGHSVPTNDENALEEIVDWFLRMSAR